MFAVLCVALKSGIGDVIEILQETMLANYLQCLGIIPVVTYILFTLILYNERGKIADA